MLENVFSGKIISPDIYPLVFNGPYQQVPEIHYRSISFYKSGETCPLEYLTYFLIGLRDLFLASQSNLLTKEEKKIFKKVVMTLDDDSLSLNLNSFDVSPYPTRTKQVVKFLESRILNLDDYPEYSQYFIKTYQDFCLVFVDPRDLSYHNFENILPLDSYFIKHQD
jgi:hypothetical protein